MDINQLPPVSDQPLSLQNKPSYARRWLIGSGVVVAVVLLISVAAAFWWYQSQLTPIQPGSREAVQIEVKEGATVATVTSQLESHGLVKSALALQLHHRLQGTSGVRAGVYTFTKGQSPAEMLVVLEKGTTDEARITFKPGETILDARKVLIAAGYSEAMIDDAFQKQYEKYPMMRDRPADANIEGFILGETYSYAKNYTVENILRQPFELLQKYIVKENLEEAFKSHGLTLYQGIILASIIQKEVSNPEDMAVVSSVFHNRLKKGMPLGSDVTAAYGVKIQGRKTSVVEAVGIDTPYNTRMHTGLPPTPIASPGFRALRAAANPAQSGYLYFVAGDDGKTYFAITNEEHERNTKAHCDKLCKL